MRAERARSASVRAARPRSGSSPPPAGSAPPTGRRRAPGPRPSCRARCGTRRRPRPPSSVVGHETDGTDGRGRPHPDGHRHGHRRSRTDRVGARLRCRSDERTSAKRERGPSGPAAGHERERDRLRVHRTAAARPRRDALPAPVDRRRRHLRRPAATGSSRSSPRCSRCSRRSAMRDIAHFLRPGHLAQLRAHPRRPRGVGQRPLRRPRPAEERLHRGRRRAADVPGHRHRHRQGQEGPVRAHRRRRRGRHRPRASSTPTSTSTCATPRWRRSRCGTRSTPAPTSRPRSRSPPSTATPTSSCSWPRAAGRPTRATCSRRPRRCSTRRA